MEALGTAVGMDISAQETQYRVLIGNIRDNINVVIEELRRMIRTHPHLQGHIEMLITLLN